MRHGTGRGGTHFWNSLNFIRSKARSFFNFLEDTQLTFRSWIVAMIAIPAVSFLVMMLAYGFEAKNVELVLVSFAHYYFMFFLVLYLLLLIFLALLTKIAIKKISAVLLWGYLLLIARPLIDKIILKDVFHQPFYIFGGVRELFSRLILYFGEMDAIGVLYGTRIITALSLVFLLWYVYFKTKSLWKSVLAAAGTYLIIFFLCALPSIVAILAGINSSGGVFAVSTADVAKMFFPSFECFGTISKETNFAIHYRLMFIYNIFLFFLLVVFQYLVGWRKFKALWNNIRGPQVTFHLGLLFMGFGLGLYYSKQNIPLDFFSLLALGNVTLATFSAWVYSVFINDLEDLKIDEITNFERPLVKKDFTKAEYQDYSLVFLFMALFFSVVVNFEFFLLVVLYVFLTWIYSCFPFRLRRFVFVSSMLSSFATLLFLFGGYLLTAGTELLEFFPWKIVLFLFFVCTLLIPLKDVKDISGDRANGVATVATLLGEENARIFFGAVLFASYVGSVFVLEEKALLLPALLFGAVSYWVVTDKKHGPRILPWWTLGIVLVYGILLVSAVFM